jgi:hypothetical protein
VVARGLERVELGLLHSHGELADLRGIDNRNHMTRGIACTVVAVVFAFGCRPAARASSAAQPDLVVAVLQTAIRYALDTAYRPEVVCVSDLNDGRAGEARELDPPAAVLSRLTVPRDILLRPISGCRQEPLSRPVNRQLVVDTLTGKRGLRVRATAPIFTSRTSFTVRLGYYQGGLSAAEWICDGTVSRDSGVEITRCKLDWVS